MHTYRLADRQRLERRDAWRGPESNWRPVIPLMVATQAARSGPAAAPSVVGLPAMDGHGHRFGAVDVFPRDSAHSGAAALHLSSSLPEARPDPGVGAHAAAVQRCGTTACDCSAEERAAHATDEQAPVGPAGGPLGAALAQRIQASRGQGQGLDDGTRASMERALGHHFADVRVHADGDADALSRGLSATAFTIGSDLFFREATYRPGSHEGDRLLAHELAHVVQQRSMEATGPLTVGPAGDSYEQEADAVAAGVGTVGAPGGGLPLQRAVVQRQDASDPQDPFNGQIPHQDPLRVPGGPLDTNDRGLSCGIKDGKFTCWADPGKGDPLELPGDWSKLGPPGPSQPGLKGPGACPPGAYNRLWDSCCPAGTQVDDAGMNCVPLPSLPAPAPQDPSQPGDYPVPDPNQDVQVA